MPDETSPIRGTKRELEEAFEWLRKIALNSAPGLTAGQAERLAAVVLQELVDLNLKLQHSLDNTDEALDHISKMANIVVEWCDREAAGDHVSKRVWEARAAHIRAGLPNVLSITAGAGHA